MEFTSVSQVCFTAKSVSSTAGRRHNMDSDLRDRLGRPFSPERRPSLDRSGRRLQRFSGKICSFGVLEFCCQLDTIKILSTSRSVFLSSDFYRRTSNLQEMKILGHLRTEGMSPLIFAYVHAI